MNGSGLSLLAASVMSAVAAAAHGESSLCPTDDTGLTLPPGFCASIFADGIGHARHLVAAPNGVVYVNTRSGRNDGNAKPPAGGFLVALRDTTGSGRADVIERFGETHRSGGRGGTGIGMYNGALYAEVDDKIVRFALPDGAIVPHGYGEPVVTGLPVGGDHPMHPFAIDDAGLMYIDVASATNSCQLQNRTPRSSGADPCTELETRGGIWRYDAKRTHQVFSPAERFATGIRNAEGFGIDAAGHRLFVTQHGRDQLHANWPDLYKPEEEATLPAEELLRLTQGGDYGWPECYYDPAQGALVLAPEYGGDGGKRRGVCAHKLAPIAVFPAHWAPDGMVFYDRQEFPAHYRRGVFIAFHGSWDRAPFPQQGYNVAFQPLAGDGAAGSCEIFADGFAGGQKSPDAALHRPTGVAVGPDGALYVSDDVRGRIYRIVYRGGPGAGGGEMSYTSCPSAAAPASAASDADNQRPDRMKQEDTDSASGDLPVPAGATKEMLLLGYRIYHGKVGNATCTGCHGRDGAGTDLGPALTDHQWSWSDGSYRGIASTITRGVSQPRRYPAPMPPLGGAQLSQEQVSALSAYVWSLSHASP